ncbi:Methionyl-tRNA formyltransferase [Arenibacter antarcticus]|uniref:phosphoribosylglycinamide formyltransferase 1 n=1 Tax=Arenibacter antarcticus TaxID=2040469 RepID=A0ABW5VHD3_9FLAO|nr:formyl transferase [Arenibacter sp. H213]MCM4167317.1 formyl transferase [Arenibacter sp. H213]
MDINKSPKKIVMITGEGEYPVMVYNYLNENNIAIGHLIIEDPIETQIFLKRRIKKLGVIKVFGQILHRLVIVPILKVTSTERIQKIKEIGRLNSILPNNVIISKVPSVNSKKCIDLLQELDPMLVVIVNTRILNKTTLSSISGKFINIHAGITPYYRGWHGGYWALVRKDTKNCGVTIHVVDDGIDTGKIVYQGIIQISKRDNYYTYPFLQLLIGLPLLKSAIEDLRDHKINNYKTDDVEIGTLFYHPTIWEYLYNRIVKKVK